MAGSPTWGKISTGIRCTASIDASATAINTTTTVSGRLSASKTSPRHFKNSPFLQISLLTRICQKRLNVSRHCRHAKQSAPDVEPGQAVIDLSLSQKALSLGDVDN